MGSADDEQLAAHAEHLRRTVAAVLEPWLRDRVRRRVGDAELSPAQRDELDRAVVAAADEAVSALSALLGTDPDEQRTTPLSVLRGVGRRPGAVLAAAGIPAPERDEFEQRAFPEDPYALAPATFADLGEQVGEAGLVWGAAKAHVHLRRRRDEGLR